MKHDIYLSDIPQRDQWIANYNGKHIGNFPLFVTAIDAVDAAKAQFETAKAAAKNNYEQMNFSAERAEELANQAMKVWFPQ